MEGTVWLTLRRQLVRISVNQTMKNLAQKVCRQTTGHIWLGSVRSLCRYSPRNSHAFCRRLKAQLDLCLTSHSLPVLHPAPQMKNNWCLFINRLKTFGLPERLLLKNPRRSWGVQAVLDVNLPKRHVCYMWVHVHRKKNSWKWNLTKSSCPTGGNVVVCAGSAGTLTVLTQVSVIFRTLFRPIPGQYSKLGHDHHLIFPLKLIIHLQSFGAIWYCY